MHIVFSCCYVHIVLVHVWLDWGLTAKRGCVVTEISVQGDRSCSTVYTVSGVPYIRQRVSYIEATAQVRRQY